MAISEVFVKCTAQRQEVPVIGMRVEVQTPAGLCHVVETEVRLWSIKVAHCVAAR